MATNAKIATFIENVENGNIKTAKEKVYYTIFNSVGRMSVFNISKFLNMKIQTVSGRLSELRDMGLIDYETVKEGSSYVSYYYPVLSKNEQEKLRKKVREERFKYWLKQGVKFKPELLSLGIDIDKLIN